MSALRILVLAQCLTDCRPHGEGLVAYEYLRRLAQQGHHLTVLASLVELREPALPNLHILRVPSVRQLSWFTNPLTSRLEFALRILPMIWRLRRKQHFDVVHQLNPVALGMNLYLPVGRTPLVLGPVFLDTMYDAPGVVGGLPALIKRSMVWQLFHRATRVAGVLPLGYALPQKATKRVRYLGFGGITPEDFPCGERPADSPAPTILFLANLREHKGIYDLLEAYKLVLAQLPGTRLVIAGDGPENQRVAELVRLLPSPAQVTLLGSIPRDSIAAVYREADVYCLPSHLEPFGMSALEAMASGMPIVATTVGGLQQIVEPEGGLLVPPRSPAALAEALLYLLRDPAMRQRMAAHNRKVVQERYSWRVQISKLEDIYSEAIAQSKHEVSSEHAAETEPEISIQAQPESKEQAASTTR